MRSSFLLVLDSIVVDGAFCFLLGANDEVARFFLRRPTRFCQPLDLAMLGFPSLMGCGVRDDDFVIVAAEEEAGAAVGTGVAGAVGELGISGTTGDVGSDG